MRWSDLVRRQPRLADIARTRLLEPGVVLVATIRRDGTPRLSPVEPFVLEDELWLSMLWGSRKAADLRRDRRVLVHSIVTSREGGDGELKLRGQAWAEEDVATQQRYADAVAADLGWEPVVGRFHLLRVEIGSVDYIRYEQPSGDQYVVRWPAGDEYVRRLTSATSVGVAERVSGVLVDE